MTSTPLSCLVLLSLMRRIVVPWSKNTINRKRMHKLIAQVAKNLSEEANYYNNVLRPNKYQDKHKNKKHFHHTHNKKTLDRRQSYCSMASSVKATKGNYASPKVTTILEEQESGDEASASEQESVNLITLSDTGEESGQTADKEFAKQPKNRDLVPPIHLADLSLSLPATPTTAINRLKPDVQDRHEKIEQALLDLQDLGVTFGQVIREQEPSQDLNLSDLARKYRTPSNRLSKILRQDPRLFRDSYETSYDTQDQSNIEETRDTSTNQEEQGYDHTSSSSSTNDEASTSTNSSSSTSCGISQNISLPPVPDGTTGAAATNYWLVKGPIFNGRISGM